MGLGAGGREGGVNFFLKETLLISATNVPLMKKKVRFWRHDNEFQGVI